MKRHSIFCAAAVLSALATTARAQAASPGDGWGVEVTPDLWMVKLNTRQRVGSQVTEAGISFHEVLKRLKAAAMGEVVIRKDNAFIFSDATYSDLNLKPPGLDAVNGKLRSKTLLLTLGGGYRFGPYSLGDVSTVTFAPFAGAAYTDLKLKLRTDATPPAPESDTHWWNPVLGARTDFKHGALSLRLGGYLARFGDGRRAEHAYAAFGYTIDAPEYGRPTLLLGYRYLNERRTFNSDQSLALRLKGPVLAATIHF